MDEELEIKSIFCDCGSVLFKVEFRTYKNEKRWVTATCPRCGKLCVRREIALDIEGRKMKEYCIFVCDGEADEVELNQAIKWVGEDPENRTATIQPSNQNTKL